MNFKFNFRFSSVQFQVQVQFNFRFNDCAVDGIQALDDLHQRATYELFPDIFLVKTKIFQFFPQIFDSILQMTNAIKNSLIENPSGHPSEGPMGLHVTAATRSPSAKGAITAASLRIKKLPEDIPIRADSENAGIPTVRLEQINEDDSGTGSGGEKSGKEK